MNELTYVVTPNEDPIRRGSAASVVRRIHVDYNIDHGPD